MRELAAVLSGRPPVEGDPAEARALTGRALEADVLAGGPISASLGREAADSGGELADERAFVVDLDLLERVALAEVGCHFLG